jgi:hypothetical protein
MAIATRLASTGAKTFRQCPVFQRAFQMGNSQYSVYGSNDEGKKAFHSFNLHSGYQLEGFNMGAFYTAGGGNSLIPEVVAGQQDTETHSNNDGYGFNVNAPAALARLDSRPTLTDPTGTANYLGSSSPAEPLT